MKIKACTECGAQFWKAGHLSMCPETESGEHVWDWKEIKMKGGRMSTTKSSKKSVPDIWASLVSKPGLGKRTGKEQIVDKGWINEKGELIHHGMVQTHQEYAIQFLRDTKDPASKTPQGKSLMQVDDILLKRGWIRVQIYAGAGMGLQGLADAVKSYGHAALALLPKPKRVYVMEFPSGETSLYTGEELSAIGLG